jgi:FAD/FMN-containing dehydrogenase
MTTDTISITGFDRGEVGMTAADLDGLRARLDGSVLLPGDSGWDAAVLVWNAMVAKEPAVVVQPTSARDVAAAIEFARDHSLRLSVKGGGHNIAGTAIAAGGLTLDMSLMREVTVDVDARLAQVGPGCQLGDVDRATQEHGLATVLGFVSEVGVAGLTLGGGLGCLTRRFGWAVDNLVEVQIVTADGQIRTANFHENSDLFWAVRGAGANLGVVTRFTFRLHEVGPTVYGGLIAWPFERADEILQAYRALTTEAPRELAVWFILLHAPPAPFVPTAWHGKKIAAMAVCFSGDLDDVDMALAPIRALGDPVVNLLQEQPYTTVQSYLDVTEPKGRCHYWKTELLADLSDDLLSTLKDVATESQLPQCEIGVLHLGGALNERDEDDGAVGNRDASYAIGMKSMWDPSEPEPSAFAQWAHDGWQRIRPYSTGRTYINFQTADEDEGRIRETYGDNYARLVPVKNVYDPENLFRVNRNIPPTT